MEIKYIEQYKCLAPNGYNIRLGGNSGKHHTDTKKKISESLKAIYKNGTVHSKPQLGKPHSEITKKKISDALKGKSISKESRDKGIETLRINRNRKIVQLDIHGNRLNEFISCKEAGEYIGCSKAGVSRCCLGRTKTLKGYIWKYESIDN